MHWEGDCSWVRCQDHWPWAGRWRSRSDRTDTTGDYEGDLHTADVFSTSTYQ